MTDLPAGADALTGEVAGKVLEGVLTAVGATLHEWKVRSVHQRGTSGVAVVWEVGFTDGGGRRRDGLYVGHASTRAVPAGAAEVDVDGARVHVWQFPHDPYLPGLAAAVNRAEAARLLRRLDLSTDGSAGPSIRTRSYRPTRRAVVELRPAPDEPPLVYVKLLGGRSERDVRRRASRLVAVHDHLLRTLPVPPVLGEDPDTGTVHLGALPGSSLRHVLRRGGELPDPRDLRQLLRGLHALPCPPPGADPDGYADVTRHVARLRAQLPELGDDLDRAAATAATVGGPRGTVHGDLHDGQLLVADGVVTGVLDVDGAGTGLLAHDLGRLVAHVEASALTVPAVADRAGDYAARLLDALAELAPRRDIAAAAAGAWLGLATGPLRVASPRWRGEAASRVREALRWRARCRQL